MVFRSRNRRRLAGVAVLVVIIITVLGLWATSAFAADGTTVPMQGQGTVVGSEEASQLRLKLTASDGSDWLLEMTLNPVNARRTGGDDDRRGVVVYALRGSFTLGLSQTPLATGTASGTMDQNGNGDINLSGTDGPTSLEVPFTVVGNGNLQAQVSGRWPALPSAQTATATDAPEVNHFWWYLSRAAGLVSYILLFLSVAFGLVLRSGQPNAGRKRVFLELHQFLSVLGLAFLGLHVAALLGDQYIGFKLANLFVPADLPYRPVPTAAGIFAMYGFVIVMLTSVVRRWLGRRTWRVVHGGAVVMFVLALVHSITAGSDTIVPWVRWMYTLTAGATALLGILHYFRQKKMPVAVTVAETSPVQRSDSR